MEGFLAIPEDEACPYEEAKAVVVPFGLEASVSYGHGTANGPAAIIRASSQVELFDEELWKEPSSDIGIMTLKEVPVKKKITEALFDLESITRKLLDDGKFPMILGGEHSITAGSIRPFAAKYPDLTILHFDAHADLRDGYEGEPYSHAAAMRRCMDHENISLVSCGIRNISAGEVPFLEQNTERIKIFWAKDKHLWDIDEILERLRGKPVYVTFDLDCFDASLMPATGTPEPGGLMWDEATRILRAASRVSRFVGADVNELAPVKELHYCDFLAAKLVYKIIAYAFAGK
ncbi:MAG TPA: agmatinase [Deltaproteobacteria bacterium]|nr:agmatinase [Deltaproteobacteria bacterium]HCY10938.1 agmatinase [Deltaproteobacteria bacterium]